MSTTRWTDTATDDLNTAVDLLIDTVANDERVSTLTWDNWQLSKAYDKTQTMILNGRNIKYNFINYSYDQISSGTRPVEDRTVKKIRIHHCLSQRYLYKLYYRPQLKCSENVEKVTILYWKE